MSWKLEVQGDNTGTWRSNALRFATEREAALYGGDLSRRWSAVRAYRATESPEPVNGRFDKGKVHWLTEAEQAALETAAPALAELLREQGIPNAQEE